MYNSLIYWFSDIEKIFSDFNDAEKVLDFSNKEKRRIFIDNDADVLLVAHLDTVQRPSIKYRKKWKLAGTGFDDRIGCAVACWLSGEIKVDVLLTDNEEIGKSTAGFHRYKDYNWIAGLDREGEDCVMYDFQCKELRDDLGPFFNIGFGSFSDICSIDGNVGRFNLGIGHRHSHSRDAICNLKTLYRQIDKFKRFHALYHDKKYRCTRPLYETDIFWNYSGCELCGEYAPENIYGRVICRDCIDYLINNETIDHKESEIDYEF